MKNYEQVTHDLLERRDQYVVEQRRKRKRVIGAASSLCCVCLVALMGVGVWKGGWFHATPSVTLDDSTVIGEKDYISPDELENNSGKEQAQQNQDSQIPSNETSNTVSLPTGDNAAIADIIGLVVIDDITYLQFSVDDSLFTADACLGDASNFDGTYKNCSTINGISATLYTVKESKNVLLVKLGNGATVVLGREGELVVNGNTYFASQIETDPFTQELYLGKAEEFEIISVPHRDIRIQPEDEVWTVKNDDTKLLIKKSDGSMILFCMCGNQ